MSKFLQITLGIVTSIGGFLEVGSIATAVQAGSEFGYQPLWAIALGTICLIFLVEMSGRIAAVGHKTVVDAIRERFGFHFFVVTMLLTVAVSFLVLCSELGGVCLALQIATGIHFQWWSIPVAFVAWLMLWRGTFGIIENGTSILGLVTVSFVVAAFKLHPTWTTVGVSLLPSLPDHESARYWFIIVSILGASISPYLMFFYSSGAIEDRWDITYLGANRMVATMGMSFGGLLSMAVLIVAALVFHPNDVKVDHFEQMTPLMTTPLPVWGLRLFALSLGIACFGAALEIALALSYTLAQGFGWEWGEDQPPKKDARFAATYTVVMLLAPIITLIGVDALKLTILSMALTALVLPVTIVPFLVIMNDHKVLDAHVNGRLSNTIVATIVIIASIVAIVAIPLEVMGSG